MIEPSGLYWVSSTSASASSPIYHPNPTILPGVNGASRMIRYTDEFAFRVITAQQPAKADKPPKPNWKNST